MRTEVNIAVRSQLEFDVLTILSYISIFIETIATVACLFEFPSAVYIHVISIIPSILYHAIPSLRKDVYFRPIALMISCISILCMISTLLMYFFGEPSGRAPFIYLIVFLFITGPCGLVGITLVMLLMYSKNNLELNTTIQELIKQNEKRNFEIKYQKLAFTQNESIV